ncbi:MAG TPA: hypothetical protein DF712_12765 [Balneola sp.]|nr:hypothetical protein [Bacteroidota bacterium]MAB66517.1 hypothetical protein [Bacteroidota bacterium]HCT53317.1 hypothetical protein [Balneola sp.]|tara:strand:+ start:371 stop:802 length:432 start_codon:yes stop_codon:yes gene_type:complete
MKLKTWFESHSNEQKKFFKDHFWGAICLVGIMSIVLVLGDEHPKYYKAQNGLFIVLVMFLLLSIIRRNGLVQIIRNTFDFGKKEITLNDITDIIFTLMIILALVSFLFILDLEFISDSGIKIGGVVALTFISLFGSLKKTFNK